MFLMGMASLGAAASHSWLIESVEEEGEVGHFSSIALDADQQPHLAYYDGTRRTLRHAWRQHDGWHIEAVDDQGDPGWYCAIAIGPDDAPVIAYGCWDGGGLRLARRAGGGWSTEEVIASDLVRHVSLDLDSEGAATIAWLSVSGPAIGLARESDSGWSTSVVTTLNSIPGWVDAATDSDGNIHLLCALPKLGQMAYSGNGGVDWRTDLTPGNCVHPLCGALCVDEGNVCAAFAWESGRGGEYLSYAALVGGTWDTAPVSGWYPLFVSVCVDHRGTAHLALSTGGRLGYATQTPTGWQAEAVGPEGQYSHASIVVDAEHASHVGCLASKWQHPLSAARMDALYGRVIEPPAGDLRLTALRREGADAVHLSWEGTTSGVTVLGAPAVASALWDPVLDSVLGSGCTVPLTTEADTGFYRLRAE